MKLNVCMAIIPLREASSVSLKTNDWARNSSLNQNSRHKRARNNARRDSGRDVAPRVEDKTKAKEI